MDMPARPLPPQLPARPLPLLPPSSWIQCGGGRPPPDPARRRPTPTGSGEEEASPHRIQRGGARGPHDGSNQHHLLSTLRDGSVLQVFDFNRNTNTIRDCRSSIRREQKAAESFAE